MITVPVVILFYFAAEDMGMDGMAMLSGDAERRYKCPECEFRGKWMFMIRKHQQVCVLHFGQCLRKKEFCWIFLAFCWTFN